MSELIIAPDAPSAACPYSPGLVVGDWIYLSGQGGFDPNTGEPVSDTIADQTTRAFRNVEVNARYTAVPEPGEAGAHHGWL